MELKKVRKKSVKKVAKKLPRTYVVIDYPQENAVIPRGAYTVRIGAPEGYSPEISINGERWSSCRSAVGYWWFDWSVPRAGTYTIETRISSTTGRLLKTAVRTCVVR